MSIGARLRLAAPALAAAVQARAHEVAGGAAPAAVWSQWNWAPSVAAPLALAAAVYLLGLWRLWRRAGIGRGIRPASAAAYGGGLLALAAALLSPLDAAAGALFSLHMIQHLLLILVAAPLIVVGAPDLALLWALPARRRGGWGRFERWAGRRLGGGAGPLLITLLAVGALWLWHAPPLYDLAVRDDAVHYAEHASFLVTALLFWATVLRLRPRDHAGNGLRILYVFATAAQGSLLGALLVLATQPLYRAHAATAPAWGLDPLRDQQLAGLIMWVPPALLYAGVIAYLFVRWLQAPALRRRERAPAKTPAA